MIDSFRDRLSVDMREPFDAGLARATVEGWAVEIRNYVDAYAVAQGCWFDAVRADSVVQFIETHCRHYKGPMAGQLFILAEWERVIVRALFGWKRPDGWRRFRKASIWVAKKNGKSTLMAALSLVLLVFDGEDGPEVYAAAVDRKQAGRVHDAAAKMARRDPELRENLRIIDSTKHIYCDANDGVLVALSADVESAEGLDISGCIIDEIHVHKKPNLVTTLMYGGKARNQPLFIAISTAGVYDPERIGWQEWEYAQGVLSGVIEDVQYYACIYAADKDDDWTDPATWRKANPALGDTLKYETFEADCYEAKKSPTKKSIFLRYQLNIWVQAAEAWCNIDAWKKCRRDFDPAMLHGRRAYGGMDLASKQDLAAFVLCVPPTVDDPLYYLLPYHWIPEAQMQARAEQHDALFPLWVNRGLITVTDGEVLDYRRVRQDILDICKPFKMVEICYDRMFAGEIVQDLEAEGLTMVEHSQTTLAMSPAMNAFETLMLQQEIVHDGNPCFTWQLGNVTVRRDNGGNIAPEKKLNRKKIDGPVASFMAVGRAVATAKPKRSVYEERGVMVL